MTALYVTTCDGCGEQIGFTLEGGWRHTHTGEPPCADTCTCSSRDYVIAVNCPIHGRPPEPW